MTLALVDAGLLALLSVVVTSVTGVLMAWIAFKQAALGRSQVELKETVVTLEKNTNSIKDALVAATRDASMAKGKEEGRREFERENKPAPAAPAPKVAVDFSAGSPGHITVVEEPEVKPPEPPKPGPKPGDVK